MPNGDELNEQLEFEERIKAMTAEDRAIFIAKQVYALTTKVDNLSITGTSKKAVATTSGITTAVIIGIIEGLKSLFNKG